jgi:hypothetical protein
MPLYPDPTAKLDSANEHYEALLASEKHRAKFLTIYTLLKRNHATVRERQRKAGLKPKSL